MNTPYFLRQGKNSYNNTKLRVQEKTTIKIHTKSEINTHRQASNSNNMDNDKRHKGVTKDNTLTRTTGYLVR